MPAKCSFLSGISLVYRWIEIFVEGEPFQAYEAYESTLRLRFKGCVRYIFASLILGLNKSTCQIKKNVFQFTSKSLFVLEKIKFQYSTFSNFMTSSNA